MPVMGLLHFDYPKALKCYLMFLLDPRAAPVCVLSLVYGPQREDPPLSRGLESQLQRTPLPKPCLHPGPGL